MSSLFTFHDTSVIDVREINAVSEIESDKIGDSAYAYYVKFTILFKNGRDWFVQYNRLDWQGKNNKYTLLKEERDNLIKFWEQYK